MIFVSIIIVFALFQRQAQLLGVLQAREQDVLMLCGHC